MTVGSWPLNNLMQSVLSWVVSVVPSSIPVIFLYQNGPRPTVDYVTINLTSFVQVGEDYSFTPTDDTGIASEAGDREFTVQIQAYGGKNVDPFQILEIIRTSLQKQTVLDTLRVNGICYANHFPINDTTVLVDTLWERRAQMDVLLRIGVTYLDDLGVIDTINMVETIYDQTGSVIETVDITVPPG
jgi:hypothetical protein